MTAKQLKQKIEKLFKDYAKAINMDEIKKELKKPIDKQ
jgi:hypothetical protein